MIEKKKLLLVFCLLIAFSLAISHVSAEKIEDNPAKYFNKIKTKNKKTTYFSYKPFKKTSVSIGQEYTLNTSSNVNYYYNKNSKFKKVLPFYYTYTSQIKYKVKKTEKTKIYNKGKYKLTIKTLKNSKGKFRYLILAKKKTKNHYTTITNPYFTNSRNINWKNSDIQNIAKQIKANVTRYNYTNKDLYNTELANSVVRYLWINIKYDYSYSKDQSALTTLKRKSGTCLGKSMLAGALLRAVGIPTYFEGSFPKSGAGHIWPVSYIFYNTKYQWICAETTRDYSNNTHNNYFEIIGNPQKERELYEKSITTLNNQIKNYEIYYYYNDNKEKIEKNKLEITYLTSLINYNNNSVQKYYYAVTKEFSSDCLILINIFNWIYLKTYFELKYPFQKNAINWWIINESGKYNFFKEYTL